eukprot:scaffold308285_cov32-Tisochrysis_lutea.AAC.3
MLAWSDARQHQQLRGLHSARTKHGFTAALEPCGTRCAVVTNKVMDTGDKERLGAFHSKFGHECPGANSQVWSAPAGRKVPISG